MDRRSLLDDDATPALEHQNIFDDEFEVEEFDIVADGMRNSDHDREGGHGGSGRPSGDAGAEEEESGGGIMRSASASRAAPAPSTSIIRPSRNSTRKSRSAMENPFASPEDDESQRMPILSFESDAALAHRSVSSASSSHFVRTASPRLGSQPSHPYGMYPQDTIGRSPSVTTASTSRPTRRQSSLRHGGPQHPYTLYPQGVGDDDVGDQDDDEDTTAQNLVPVGFPGHGQTYHRQRGPDGEEQDIIGEDGHSEPLPPYTRYPEDGPEKMPLLVPSAPTALHSRAPVAGTDPGMPLMHTAIQPQADRPPATEPAPASMSDQSTLLRSYSQHSRILPSNASTTNKSWNEKSWKEKRKTKVCGVPFWWILLSVCVLIFIAAVLGGVIGGFVENVSRHNHGLSQMTTSLYDASALAATPTVVPPTGTFALSLSTPQATQAQCLTSSGQQAAWSCDIGGDPDVAIVVEPLQGANQSGANIFYASDDQQVCYGTQASYMQTQFAEFITVVDNEDPNNGPAFYFQSYYDKVVVVPETALNMNSKRQTFNLAPGWLQQKQVAQAGDRPWVCVWNNTFVEGFVFIQQPVNPSYTMTSSGSAAMQTNASGSYGSSASATSGSGGYGASSATTPPPSVAYASPGGPPMAPTFTTTYTDPRTTATFVGPPSQYPAWSAQMAQQDGAASQSQSSAAGYTSSSTGGYASSSTAGGSSGGYRHKEKRQDTTDDGCLYDSLQLYPYVVKLEERRLSGNTVQPYCQQVQVLDNGQTNPVNGADGQPNIIKLDEVDPGYGAYQSAGIAGGKMSRRRGKRTDPGGCHCQWMSGQ